MMELRVSAKTESEKLGGAIAALIIDNIDHMITSVGVVAESKIVDAFEIAKSYLGAKSYLVQYDRTVHKNQILDDSRVATIVRYTIIKHTIESDCNVKDNSVT